MSETAQDTQGAKSPPAGTPAGPAKPGRNRDKGSAGSAQTGRRELRRVWFVHNVTLDGSTLKDFLQRPEPKDGTPPAPHVPRCYIVGEGQGIRIEWESSNGRRQQRIVPMSNVICFEALRDAAD